MTRLSVVGEITTSSSIELFAAIRAARGNSISVTIDSEGGSASGALGIFELLTLHDCQVTALIERASSNAVEVAMAGDIRHVTPGARLMIHGASADLKGAGVDILWSTIADIERLDAIAIEILAAATRRTPEHVANWVYGATKFSAHEAIAAGLAHEIA